MIAFLVSLALRAGVPQRFARVAAIGVLALALIAAFFIGKAIYDHRLIARHDAKANATAERQARESEHKADTATNPITNANAAEHAARQEAIRNATDQHPQDAARPVGPASNAVIDRLRQRQRGAHKTSP
jgi:flagellar biosynthesis/type III secretory pathway M-ring protein FliF/YscJ